MIPLKPFYMIRHGESIANLDGYYSGQMDVPLTETGIKQAEQAALIVGRLEQKPHIIFHSHLSRARDTAGIINKHLGVEMIENKDISEHDVGDWQGTPNDSVTQSMREGVDPPNGESHKDFHARVARGIGAALGHDEQSIPLIVCHGGVFRGFAANFGFDLHRIQNCIVHEFIPAPGQNIPWKIISYQEDGANEIAL